MQLPEPVDRESLTDRLRAHLGADPLELPVVGASYPPYDQANVHLALTAWFGGEPELVGVSGMHRGHHTLTELLQLAGQHGAFGVGPVDYANVAISPDDELACVDFGFFLGAGADGPVAVLCRSPAAAGLRHGERDGGGAGSVTRRGRASARRPAGADRPAQRVPWSGGVVRGRPVRS